VILTEGPVVVMLVMLAMLVGLGRECVEHAIDRGGRAIDQIYQTKLRMMGK
jgi:hypothetical protein